MDWMLLALGAQTSVSIAAFIDKHVLERHRVPPSLIAVLSGFWSLGLATTLVVVRGIPAVSGGKALVAGITGALSVIYLIPYLRALGEGDASAVVSLFQLVPVFTLLIARVALGERLHVPQIVGFALVFGAAALYVRSTSDLGHIRKRVALSMGLASLIAACADVLWKWLLTPQSFWDIFTIGAAGAGVASFALLLVTDGGGGDLRRLPAGVCVKLAAAETFNLGFLILLLGAISRGPVSLVSVSEGVQPFILLALGVVITRWWPAFITEGTTRVAIGARMAAGFAVFAGVILMTGWRA